MTRTVLALLFCSSLAYAQGPAAAQQAGGDALSVSAKDSTLTYHLVHKLHRVDGVSRQVEGKALLQGGQAKVMIRAKVASFDSGNSNRDEHMKEAAEEARFPVVELKAAGADFTPPATYPATVDKTFKAQLSFHGVQKTMDVPVHLVYDSADRIHATASLVVSLDEFKVERPSLMFVKVNDDLKIDANLVFAR